MKKPEILCQICLWALIVLLVCVYPNQVRAETEVSGPYFSDVMWTLAGSPYVLKGDVQVARDVTLTIEPGVVARYTGPYELLVKGRIVANGTAESPIVFTAEGVAIDEDDVSGTTLLKFKETDLSVSELSYVQMEHAFYSIRIGEETEHNQGEKNTNTLTVSNAEIRDACILTDGYDTGARLKIVNSTISSTFIVGQYPRSEIIEIINGTIRNCTIRSDSYNHGIILKNSSVSDTSFSIGCGDANIRMERCFVYDSNIEEHNSHSRFSAVCSKLINTPVYLPSESSMDISNCLFFYDGADGICCRRCFFSNSSVVGTHKGSAIVLEPYYGYDYPDRCDLVVSNSLIVGNTVGISIGSGSIAEFQDCNIFRNNTYNLANLSCREVDAKHNYWGTADPGQIANRIWDYYDNINLGIVNCSYYLCAPNPDAPVSPPNNVMKSSVAGGVRVSWDLNPEPDVAGYKVHWGLKDDYSFQYVEDVGDGSDHTIAGLSTTDVIGVTAYDDDADGTDDMIEGHESWYGHAEADNLSYIATPTDIQASDGLYDEMVRVTWTEPNRAKGYQVWRGETDDVSCARKIADTVHSTYDDGAVSAGVLYYYWIKATNAFVSSRFSGSDSGWAEGLCLSMPAGVTATDGTYTDKVRISWNQVRGATGYEVWRAITEDFAGAVFLAEADGTSFHDTSITRMIPGMIYYYWVRAKNSEKISKFGGPDSGWAGESSLGTVTGVTASDGTYCDKVRVIWDAVTGAAGYELWRSSEDDIFTVTRLIDTACALYDDNDVTPGTIYYYWVRAFNENETGGMSDSDGGYAAEDQIITGEADLEPRTLHFVPGNLWAGDHPAMVSLLLFNHGPDNMMECDTRVEMNFYLSLNMVFGDVDDILIGAKQENVELLAGNSTNLINPGRPSNTDVTIPYGLSGEYYVFVEVQHIGSSSLTDSNHDNSYTMRDGTVQIRPHPVRGVVNDFDGDGKSDMALFHQSTGAWYIRSVNGSILKWGEVWGGPGFEPVSGDFDGDGKSDLGVYYEQSGCWYIRGDAQNVLVWGENWGGNGFAVLTGDFDSDGKSDLVAYQESAGNWFIRTVSGEVLVWGEQWGGKEFSAVRGDYDNDGKSDLAVYCKDSGAWFIRTIDGAPLAWGETWGGAEMKAVAGDYDGDGQNDFGVYHCAAGLWYVKALNGSSILWEMLYGGADLKPVPGDYDGDAATDLAMYHEQTGRWYIITASGNPILWGAEWGGPGLKPVGAVE